MFRIGFATDEVSGTGISTHLNICHEWCVLEVVLLGDVRSKMLIVKGRELDFSKKSSMCLAVLASLPFLEW